MEVSDSSRKECFTPVQSRRFWAPSLVACRLCPSMDLMVLGQAGAPKNETSSSPKQSSSLASTVAYTSQLSLYRTLSGQKLATLQASALNDTTGDNAADEDDRRSVSGITHACWRPDGRLLACAETTGRVALFRVESLLSSTPLMNDAMSSADASSSSEVVASFRVTNNDRSQIRGLVWAHVGRPHPLWSLSQDEVEDQISWEYQSRFVDRQGLVLPPSQYHQTTELPDESGASALPTCQTPLSLLCVATQDDDEFHLHVYSHGCYPILRDIPLQVTDVEGREDSSFKDSLSVRDVSMVVSSDLSHILVWASQSSTMTLYSMPTLSQNRYDLQIISSLYSSTTKHLRVLQKSVTEILAAWKSSIKPLDLKLDALTRLLKNYGLVDPQDSSAAAVRRLLVQYILSGHTRTAYNLSNAMDQFFTGVQMNDQLVQRMEASLTVSVANVETQVRQYLLSPAQVLLYQVSTFHNNPFVATTDLIHWKLSCEMLWQSVQATWTALVEARLRLRDWVAWLRAVSAQIKARGTAAQSARRETAKKRRVPGSVVQRMLTYLQKPQTGSGGFSITEEILDLQFGSFLQQQGKLFVEQRSVSPSSVMVSPCTTTPTVPAAVEKAQELAQRVFAGPPRYLQQKVQAVQIKVPSGAHCMAMTTRLGCGDIDARQIPFGEPKPDGFFCPPTQQPSPDARSFRQWSLVALPVSSNDGLMLRLYALPLHWTPRAGLGDRYAWTVDLHLPAEYIAVEDLDFYQDDGKSSLSSGLDSGSGKESANRQALVILLRRTNGLELWLVPYQDLVFDVLPLNNDNDGSLVLPQQAPRCQYQVKPLLTDMEDPRLQNGVLYARTRTLGAAMTESRVVLSGPRGIAAVFGRQQLGTVLDLYDFEEDEEQEEDGIDEEVED